MDNSSDNAGSVGIRWPELGVALLLLALGTLVVVDSIRVGTGWGDDGPRSGYFPFYIGLGLLASSGWIALQQVLNWSRTHGEFAERQQLALVWAIFWPMVVFVGLVAALGIYIASVVLISYFMRRHGGHKLPTVAAVSVGVPLVCFAVFERWFMVPLPKGPIEALLGL